jgi:hypothetical protein
MINDDVFLQQFCVFFDSYACDANAPLFPLLYTFALLARLDIHLSRLLLQFVLGLGFWHI